MAQVWKFEPVITGSDGTNRLGRGRIRIAFFLGVILLVMLESGVQAQGLGSGRTTAPIIGSMGMTPAPPDRFQSMNGIFAPNSKTPDGKLCIKINASAHPQIVNPKIIDQIVIVENICSQAIRVQVCYVGSTDCIIVPLAGYQRLQRLLGISANTTAFSYEFRELF